MVVSLPLQLGATILAGTDRLVVVRQLPTRNGKLSDLVFRRANVVA